ncbi:chitinase-3-like protein 1 [Physella acuta]|uniref:chitinase-3-like protein 1 n=1 Tax=Physella acuta TaxID=109671 RepID=UPI0027DCF532|nr:chitinase-3-like protein 1 [Physella acuta]
MTMLHFLTWSLAIISSTVLGQLRVCYVTNWTHQRESEVAKFDFKDIDPSICTHLIYAFGVLDTSSRTLRSRWPETEESPGGRYSKFNELKRSNPGLKTLLSLGGQQEHGAGFTSVSQSEEIAEAFADSTILFLRKFGFDGLDIDWEYPNSHTKDTYAFLLKMLRSRFDVESAHTRQARLLLTIAAPAGRQFIDPGFDIPEIAKYVDYVNIMTYDYTSQDANVTAFNSPLFSTPDVRFDPTLSTNWTVHYYKELGLPFSQMVLGITGVGRWLTLEDENAFGVGSKTTRQRQTSSHYQLVNGMTYPEICLVVKRQPGARRYFDDVQKSPYLVWGNNWVGYEDPESVRIKAKWTRSLGVAGIMMWSLDQDDFSGKYCQGERFPLLNAAKKVFDSFPSPEVTVKTDPTLNLATTPPHQPHSPTTILTATKSTRNGCSTLVVDVTIGCLTYLISVV